ncbi:unnamed protein product [Clonostachys solani]|uniref:Ubiquitin-like protease family profile domain-containing protein n=1 Tax=Clonostachys solani TaxID=160281 RepID=A0A9N9ZEG6_9HYPO|nr:unnamed protein product [Clonostachys solani]
MIVPKDCEAALGKLGAANSVDRDNRSDTSTPESLLSAPQANPSSSDSTIPTDDNGRHRKRQRTIAEPIEIQSGDAFDRQLIALNNSPIISAADSESCSERTRSLFAITKIDIESLRGMAMLSSTVIFALLRFVEEIVGSEKAKVIEPLHISNSHTDIHPNAIILIPYLMEDSHWVIGIIREDRSRVDVFDSRPSTNNDKAARQKIMEFYTRSIGTESTPAFNHSSPLRQSEENKVDSGVYVIIAGMCQMIGESIPTWVDVPGCRRFLLSLLYQDSCNDGWEDEEALESLQDLCKIGRPDHNGPHLQLLLKYTRKSLESKVGRMEKNDCSPFAEYGLILVEKMKASLSALEVHSTDVELRLQEAEKGLKKEMRYLELQKEVKRLLKAIEALET